MSAQARQHTGRLAARCLGARRTPGTSNVTHPAAFPPQAGASQRRAPAGGIPAAAAAQSAGALAETLAGAAVDLPLDPASSGRSLGRSPLERSHQDAIRRAASRATAGSASLGGSTSSSRPHRANARPTLLSSTSQPQPPTFTAAASRPQHQQQRVRFSHSLASAAKHTTTISCCPFPAARHIASKPHLTLTGCDASSLLLFRVSCSPRHLRKQLIAVMGSAAQTRDHGGSGHGGHSHSHSHSHSHAHHDNSFLVSANTSDPGVRITRIGLLSNLLMAVAKFIGGWTFGSKAMVADAWHSITDLASDVLTLATVSWSIKPPTDKFPLGFGKVESLGSLGVSGMLVVGGFYMGWESAISLFGHVNPEMAHTITEHVGHGHGHSHSHSAADLGIPSLHAAWLAGATILIKEWLYHATIKVARERKSSVLASNAIHHRVDSLTGIVTLAAIVGANVVENAAWLDPVGGLLISLMVIKAGVDNTKMALYELADVSVDDEFKASVRKQTQRAIANVADGHVAELRDVSGIKSGQNYLVDLELAVPGSWTVESLRELEDAVRAQVGAKVRGVRRVRVRFASQDAPVNEKFDEFVKSTVDADPADENEDENGHANGSANGHNHKH